MQLYGAEENSPKHDIWLSQRTIMP